MKKTKLLTIFLLLTMLWGIFVLASCGVDNHIHNYSTDWAKDGSCHWQACSGCDDIRNKTEHDWNSGIITLSPTETSEGIKTFTCNTCGQTRVESIPVMIEHKHIFSDEWSSNDTHHWHMATCEHTTEKKDYAEHDWNDGEITTQPTTSKEGIKTYSCIVCQKTRTEEIPKLEEVHTHNFNQRNTGTDYLKSTATCTEKAVYYYSCLCGVQGMETFEFGSALDHAFTNYVSNRNATCTEDGTKTAICDRCKNTTNEIVDVGSATGHSFSTAWAYNDSHHWHSATCEHTTEKKDYAGHDWNEGVVTTDPTTTSKGVKTFTCESCNKTKTEEIPKLEEVHTHNFNQRNTGSDYLKSTATCTQKAVYYYSCVCGLKGSETFEHGNVLDHKFTNYTSNYDATCTIDGTKTAKCDICGVKEDTITDVGSATGHTYSTEWSSDNAKHWHAAICEHTSEYSHKEAHHWDAGVVTKDPTEATEGEKTYTCDVCGKTKVENIGKLDHVHTYDTEYTYDENYHWHAATCPHTSEVKDKTIHNWDKGVVDFEATVYDEGIKVYTCQDCGYKKEEVISKIPSFTVIFYDAENKTISSKNYKLATPSSQVTAPRVQAGDGYQFEEWVEATTGKAITDIDFSLSIENTVYQFKPSLVKVFEIVFIDFEGNQLGETLLVQAGETITASDLPAIPERTGYTSKWDENSIVGVSIAGNQVYSPIYEVVTFTVTFFDAKGGNKLAEGQEVEYGSFAIIPEYDQYRFNSRLYAFTGWKSAATDLFVDNVSGNKVIDVYSNMELYAVYDKSIEEPIIAIHIDGATVTMSLCMPDNTSLYSINMSMAWILQEGICKIESASVANTTSLNSDTCSDPKNKFHINKGDWLTYNNNTQTFDFVWACGSGHSFVIDNSIITINFGVNNGGQVIKEIFSILDNSTIVYGKNGTSIDDLQKSNIKIWFY